jgi:hypothetical protein
MNLQRLARRANEIAQDSNIGAIRAYAAGVHGQAQALGEIEVHTSVIKLGKTETRRGQNAIQARRVHRPRWAVTLPGAARQLVKLLPIAFVPSGHAFHRDPGPAGIKLSRYLAISLYVPLNPFDALRAQKDHLVLCCWSVRRRLPQRLS